MEIGPYFFKRERRQDDILLHYIGATKNLRDVKELVAKFNIQLDNLCQVKAFS